MPKSNSETTVNDINTYWVAYASVRKLLWDHRTSTRLSTPCGVECASEASLSYRDLGRWRTEKTHQQLVGRCESRGYCWRVASASIRAYVLLLAGGNKIVTNKIQRVINAAARVVSGTRKYDRGLRQLRHAELHWLDVADRVTFKLSMTVHKWLHSHAPDYWAVYTGRPSLRTTAPSFGQPPPTRRAKNTARHVQPSCVRRGRSDSLERTQPRSERSRSQHRQLQSPT